MKPENISHISEFILLGFSEEPEVQSLVFVLFLSIYLITVLGNLLLILAVSSDPRLHTPMYFFLANLSFVDICVISNTIPKLLVSVQTQNKSITYEYCFTQMVFFLLLSGLDVFFLTAMAYDRFVAICHPLHYTVIMNPRVCGLLLLGSWAMSILDCLLHSLMTLTLSFCSDVFIPNFFCELKQIVQLSCSDTFVNDVVMYVGALLVGGSSLSGILYSYSKIVSSIYRITSVRGKYKAFSTCASHLSMVSLFYCTVMGAYLSSAATQSSLTSSITSAMYTVVTPMLNPFIYSLRNNDIKRALRAFFVKGTIKRPL